MSKQKTIDLQKYCIAKYEVSQVLDNKLIYTYNYYFWSKITIKAIIKKKRVIYNR